MLKYLRNAVTLQLDVKTCNGCSMCISVCPRAVFDMKDRKAVIVDKDACIECGACSINCPVNAIRVQTGAGCAAGILLGALGMDNCCSGACGASPAVAESNQVSCCEPIIENKDFGSYTSQTLGKIIRQKEKGMTKNFIIYESAMCCSSGVCGPNPDQSLIQLQDTIEKIQDMGARVERYSITGHPKKFRENPEVISLIQKIQIKALPITTCNGRVFKVAGYPSLDEFRSQLDSINKVEAEVNLGTPAAGGCCSGQSTPVDEGCCSGQNYCDISCGPAYEKNEGTNSSRCC